MWLIDDNGRSKHLYRKGTRCHEIWPFVNYLGLSTETIQ